MNQAGLQLQHVYKSFSKRAILKNISLSLEPGTILAVIGPSGGGKSTLLRCINLLTPIDKGNIYLNGEMLLRAPANKVRQKIGMVFQEWNLWPDRTVLENIAEGPLFVLGIDKKVAYEQAEELAQEVDIKEKLYVYPQELSGGQKQRVAIARALAMNPEVLMLDEITSALDPLLTSGILDLLAKINLMGKIKDKNRSFIIVTHHIEFAKKVADNVAFLYQGKIHEYGEAKSLLEDPKTPELKHFLQTLEKTH